MGVPHEVFYRPSLRCRVRDGFCPLSEAVVPRTTVPAPDDQTRTVAFDGPVVHEARTGDRFPDGASLIADMSSFMTLLPGDVRMTGVAHGALLVHAGLSVRVASPGLAPLGSIGFRFV